MQSDHNKLEKYFDDNLIKINTKKTNYTILYLKTENQLWNTLTFSIQITRTNETIYLELNITKTIDWTSHIK